MDDDWDTGGSGDLVVAAPAKRWAGAAALNLPVRQADAKILPLIVSNPSLSTYKGEKDVASDRP